MGKPNRMKASHKGRRMMHNKSTGKYVRQFARTEANKKRRIARFWKMVEDSRRRKGAG